MQKYILFLIIIIINLNNAITCTTFVIKTKDDLVFGRNLDWVSDNGIIVANQRNVSKSSLVFPPEKPIKWTSKYGSITFNQFGKEFPYGGINEKGLVVEIMVAKAQYEKKDERKAINELQWIQYQLDNFATIDEVLSSNKLLRISPVYQELHYFICDNSGRRAVIEYIDNKMVVYKDENLPIPVLENNVYNKSLNQFENQNKCRFTTAANMVKKYTNETKENVIAYSFEILKNVVLSGEWSIVYDIKNMEIHFKTASDQAIKQINLKSFNFDCNSKTYIYDLKVKNSGNIDMKFIEFSTCINNEKLEDAIKDNNLDMYPEVLSIFKQYHKECKCE